MNQGLTHQSKHTHGITFLQGDEPFARRATYRQYIDQREPTAATNSRKHRLASACALQNMFPACCDTQKQKATTVVCTSDDVHQRPRPRKLCISPRRPNLNFELFTSLSQVLTSATLQYTGYSTGATTDLELLEPLVHVRNILRAGAWVIPVVHVVLGYHGRGNVAPLQPLQPLAPQLPAGLSTCSLLPLSAAISLLPRHLSLLSLCGGLPVAS